MIGKIDKEDLKKEEPEEEETPPEPGILDIFQALAHFAYITAWHMTALYWNLEISKAKTEDEIKESIENRDKQLESLNILKAWLEEGAKGRKNLIKKIGGGNPEYIG